MTHMGSTGAWLKRCLWLAYPLVMLLIAVMGMAMVQSYRRLTHPVPGALVTPPPTSLQETLPPEALDSGDPTIMTEEDWDAIRREGLARLRTRSAPPHDASL